MTTRQHFVDAADRHLPASIARRWVELLRPAIDLDRAEDGDTVVGHLGGDPLLPAGQPWPTWEGQGPLTLIASLDCSRLPKFGLPLPASGLLQFFYFDGRVDDSRTLVNGRIPETHGGARVIFLPEESTTEPRPHPEGISAYDPTSLRAAITYSAPDEQSPVLATAFGAEDQEAADALSSDDFIDEIAPWDKPLHQIGGYPAEVQGPPEDEVVIGTRPDLEPGGPAFHEESAAWRLLLQVGEVDETEMLWGDTGNLYWMAKTEVLESADFDRAMFTWQSG